MNQHDESRWFNSVSETYNTKNTTVNLDSNNLTKESILESIKIFDEPYSDRPQSRHIFS